MAHLQPAAPVGEGSGPGASFRELAFDQSSSPGFGPFPLSSEHAAQAAAKPLIQVFGDGHRKTISSPPNSSRVRRTASGKTVRSPGLPARTSDVPGSLTSFCCKDGSHYHHGTVCCLSVVDRFRFLFRRDAVFLLPIQILEALTAVDRNLDRGRGGDHPARIPGRIAGDGDLAEFLRG